MIDNGLLGTSVTVVLIGPETASRPYVLYEIQRSIERGNGLLGVYIHNIKNAQQQTDLKGGNPLPANYPVYDYVLNDGYKNLGVWIESAAQAASK